MSDWRALTAADVMSTDVRVAYADQSLEEAARRMSEDGISGLPVLASDETPIGVLSLSDIAHFLADVDDPLALGRFAGFYDCAEIDDEDGWSHEDLALDDEATVEDAMNPQVVCITPELGLGEVARRMWELRARRLLVVDEASVLVGIVSVMDVMGALCRSEACAVV